jgi:hypothetical protein
VSVEDPGLLGAARAHARERFSRGLTSTEILVEVRLLRQEIGRTLRRHMQEQTPISTLFGAEQRLYDALDWAALLSISALSEPEPARQQAEHSAFQQGTEPEDHRGLYALLKTLPVGFAFLDRDLRYVGTNERSAELNSTPVVNYRRGWHPCHGNHRAGARRGGAARERAQIPLRCSTRSTRASASSRCYSMRMISRSIIGSSTSTRRLCGRRDYTMPLSDACASLHRNMGRTGSRHTGASCELENPSGLKTKPGHSGASMMSSPFP